MEAGQSFEVLSQEPDAITIAEMNHVFAEDIYNDYLLRKAIATAALPEDWRDHFSRRLAGPAVVER